MVVQNGTGSGGTPPVDPFQALKTKVEELQREDNFGGAVALLEEAWKARSGFPTVLLSPVGRKSFSAREWIALAPGSTDDVSKLQWIKQRLAFCTYKDENLPAWERLPRAIAHLEDIGLGTASSAASETLRLGGAIYRRFWEYDGRLDRLQQALALYRTAYERDIKEDLGYGGTNAAFILHVLASRQRAIDARAHLKSKEADNLVARAHKLYKEMAESLPPLEPSAVERGEGYWFSVAMAEVQIGLGHPAEASPWLRKARQQVRDPWKLESTFRQLVQLALFKHQKLPAEKSDPETWHPVWKALRELLGEDTAQALYCFRGRVGLALSGGGFRASLYHLGVLARLAEMDVLRSVDVLSTVSGGSIVGAHYYLELQELIQNQPDKAITKDVLIGLVKTVAQEFLSGVGKNLRTRVVSSPVETFRMMIGRSSRSRRIGQLYEKHLYSRVKDHHPADKPRTMPELLMKPQGAAGQTGTVPTYKPKFSNWRRRSKVPILLLNTTSLNSGHSWHFTASWMGEPPGLVGSEIDKNDRYRRLYYREAPDPYKEFPLSDAVAASSCVPALFEPLTIHGLFDERVVRLVDGGVHDNQGTGALLDEGCGFVLCSDASGQMEDLKQPGDSLLSVPVRTNSILMSRVREVEYQDLLGREESGSLKGLFFVHLKQGLQADALNWIGCTNPVQPSPTPPLTPFGIEPGLQRHLASIRTDLDSFSEVEAYSLMCSGYLMTKHQFEELQKQHLEAEGDGTWGGFDVAAPTEVWKFLEIRSLLALPSDSPLPQRKDLEKQLRVGSKAAFKIWILSPALTVIAVLLALLGLGAFGYLTVVHWQDTLVHRIPVGKAVTTLALVIGGLAIPGIKWLFDPKTAKRNVLVRGALWFVAMFASWVHLLIFDPLFLCRGRLSRLSNLK